MAKKTNERQSRAGLLAKARALNCEGDVKQILEKYDRALLKCTNEQERYQISITGLAELHRFLYCAGPLIVNGQEILPAAPDFKESGGGKFNKL